MGFRYPLLISPRSSLHNVCPTRKSHELQHRLFQDPPSDPRGLRLHHRPSLGSTLRPFQRPARQTYYKERQWVHRASTNRNRSCHFGLLYCISSHRWEGAAWGGGNRNSCFFNCVVAGSSDFHTRCSWGFLLYRTAWVFLWSVTRVDEESVLCIGTVDLCVWELLELVAAHGGDVSHDQGRWRWVDYGWSQRRTSWLFLLVIGRFKHFECGGLRFLCC